MADRLSTTFAALADPTRRRMLQRLARGTATMSMLAQPLAMSLPAAAKHVRVLERSGLIARGRRAQSRPCHLRLEPLREALAWMETYRKYWEESFDRLEAHLESLAERKKKSCPQKKVSPPPAPRYVWSSRA